MWFKAIILATLIPLLLVHCQRQGELKRPADTVFVAIHSEPKRLNPVFLTDSISYSVSGLIFNGLTKFDETLSVKADLAESWDIKRNGLDIVFYLKKGIFWHDGKEFTADDVIFTYKVITSQKTATHHAENFGPLKEVEAIDRYTVKATYSKPFSTALESWSIGIIPKHILENSDINDHSFDKSPIGTGPYRLKEWTPGQKLVFEAFKNFHERTPKIKSLIVKIIPDPSTRLMELKTGNIDLMEITPAQFSMLTDETYIKKNFNKYIGGNSRYGFLGFNLKDGRFSDTKVRQAISHAIDKEAIIKAIFKDLGSLSTGPYPKNAWYHNHDISSYEFNPAKAIKLLEDSGWKRGADNLLFKNGKPFEFNIITNIENRDNINIAQMIQADLRKVGIKVDIKTFEWQTFRFQLIAKRQFETVLMSRGYLWSPDIYDLWHSSKTGEGKWNFLSYRNHHLDSLLEKARVTMDYDQRKRLYYQIHEILAADQPCIFLYHLENPFIAHKRIKGISTTPLSILEDLYKWEIFLP